MNYLSGLNDWLWIIVYVLSVINHRFNYCLIRTPLPPYLKTFPSSDSDKIWYVNLFWDGICDVCIVFFRNFPSPRNSAPFPPNFTPRF